MASAQPSTPQRPSAGSRGPAADISSLASAALAPFGAVFGLSTFSSGR
ncbi:hypothetical protein JOE40_002815 [Arthrobacter sp. PvP102]|nr:hypothetical protein [Arthrobacter sp. PvP103]MBP1238306.1 hypothetical protein [Arthrobacter sp. PvP102]